MNLTAQFSEALAWATSVHNCPMCNRTITDAGEYVFTQDAGFCGSCENAIYEAEQVQREELRNSMEIFGLNPDNTEDVLIYMEGR